MLVCGRSLVEAILSGPVILACLVVGLPRSSLTHRSTLGALQKWRRERGYGASSQLGGSSPAAPVPSPTNGSVCERVVVFSKRDLVPEWGIKVCIHAVSATATLMRNIAQPFQRALANRYADQKHLFASWNRARDIRALSELLVSMSQFLSGVRARRFIRLFQI